MSNKKRFFAKHAKSSAALVSLGIHALIILIAVSFVAVSVIQKEEKSFEAKPVNRPKMSLRKLQVPVNIKKKRMQQPKLRKRIVVQPKMDQVMPDIKIPEISGVKGGFGNMAGEGLGGTGTIGFTMPEIQIFGVKGKGEKIVLILGADSSMMADKIGGIEAYSIIKDELVRIVGELPPTALFNVLVYDWKEVAMAFPNMVPASDSNAQKMKEWIQPLNAVKKGMGGKDYGLQTLNPGGTVRGDKPLYGKFADTGKVGADTDKVDVHDWYRAVMYAHEMGADTIFVLTDTWGMQRVVTSASKSRAEWDQTTAGKKWQAAYKEGLEKLDEENRARAAAGKPPKIIARNEWSINKEYNPDLQRPPASQYYYFTPKDFLEAFQLCRAEHGSNSPLRALGGLRKKGGRQDFTFNVIQFVPLGGGDSEGIASANFGKLTGDCNGEYKTISGLAEIQSYIKPEEQ